MLSSRQKFLVLVLAIIVMQLLLLLLILISSSKFQLQKQCQWVNNNRKISQYETRNKLFILFTGLTPATTIYCWFSSSFFASGNIRVVVQWICLSSFAPLKVIEIVFNTAILFMCSFDKHDCIFLEYASKISESSVHIGRAITSCISLHLYHAARNCIIVSIKF